MWTNNQSIAKQEKKLSTFKPPYCANPFCPWHQPSAVDDSKPFQKFGTKVIRRYPYFSQRFRCKKCWKTFSGSFFTLEYRDRRPNSYEEIHDLSLNGYSGISVAKRLKINEDTVRRRKKKLARWALLQTAKDQEGIKIKESVAFDGLENFAYSQYDPNNLNHAVGRESYYVYDFNLSIMNRKGRMSPRQQGINEQLEEHFGRYDGGAIQKDSQRIFERLLSKCETELHLHSDNHYAYRRALKNIKGEKMINHSITPAKLTRNFRNRLFAINHTDMLTRHHLGTFKRETIAFAKNAVAMMEGFILLASQKNYMRPRFLKKQKRDSKAHIESPAMHLGLRDKIQTFSEFYRMRISVHHVKLSQDWQDLFDSTYPPSRRTIRAHAGI